MLHTTSLAAFATQWFRSRFRWLWQSDPFTDLSLGLGKECTGLAHLWIHKKTHTLILNHYWCFHFVKRCRGNFIYCLNSAQCSSAPRLIGLSGGHKGRFNRSPSFKLKKKKKSNSQSSTGPMVRPCFSSLRFWRRGLMLICPAMCLQILRSY